MIFKRFNVTVVLPDRVVEFVFVFVNGLRPVLLMFATEDPAAVVFRFDDMDAVF